MAQWELDDEQIAQYKRLREAAETDYESVRSAFTYLEEAIDEYNRAVREYAASRERFAHYVSDVARIAERELNKLPQGRRQTPEGRAMERFADSWIFGMDDVPEPQPLSDPVDPGQFRATEPFWKPDL